MTPEQDPLLAALRALPARDLPAHRGEAVRRRVRRSLRIPMPPLAVRVAFACGLTGALGAYLAWAMVIAAQR